MQPRLVYLHGLNSSSQSVKANLLRERLSDFQVLALDYPAHRPDEAMVRLSRFFLELGEVGPAVIGSSMGGFYGQYLARRFRFSHLYLVNPAITPWTFLTEHLGETMTTADGEPYLITQALCDSARRYGIADPCDGVPTTVFLDRGDEVLDYRIAEGAYADCGRVLIWDGGNHAFAHMETAIEIIREHLESSRSKRPDVR